MHKEEQNSPIISRNQQLYIQRTSEATKKDVFGHQNPLRESFSFNLCIICVKVEKKKLYHLLLGIQNLNFKLCGC